MYNQRTYMKTFMKGDEAKKVCVNRTMWSDIVSAYPRVEKAYHICMYVSYSANICANVSAALK